MKTIFLVSKLPNKGFVFSYHYNVLKLQCPNTGRDCALAHEKMGDVIKHQIQCQESHCTGKLNIEYSLTTTPPQNAKPSIKLDTRVEPQTDDSIQKKGLLPQYAVPTFKKESFEAKIINNMKIANTPTIDIIVNDLKKKRDQLNETYSNKDDTH